MWLIGLWFGALLLFVAVRYVAGRNQDLEIRRRELVMLRADLEALVEEGEIFREDESYQILMENPRLLIQHYL